MYPTWAASAHLLGRQAASVLCIVAVTACQLAGQPLSVDQILAMVAPLGVYNWVKGKGQQATQPTN
jgi:hypothetical protein